MAAMREAAVPVARAEQPERAGHRREQVGRRPERVRLARVVAQAAAPAYRRAELGATRGTAVRRPRAARDRQAAPAPAETSPLAERLARPAPEVLPQRAARAVQQPAVLPARPLERRARAAQQPELAEPGAAAVVP